MARSSDYIGATGIGVSDLKRSAGFYVRALGMQEMRTVGIDYMDEIILGHEGRNAVVLCITRWFQAKLRDNPVVCLLCQRSEGCRRSHPRRGL
jgi:hypothetical protein